MILGDFNAHNTLWGSAKTSYTGRKVAKFVADSDNVILNNEDPTHIDAKTGKLSAIEISIASAHLSLDI